MCMGLLFYSLFLVLCMVSSGDILHVPMSLHTTYFEGDFDLTIDTEYNTDYQVIRFCNEHVLVTSMCDQLVDLVRDYRLRSNLVDSPQLPPEDVVTDDITNQWRKTYDPDRCIEFQLVSFCSSLKLPKPLCQQIYEASRQHYTAFSCLQPSRFALISAPIPLRSTEILNIWSYWDRGYEGMPPILQKVYDHNHKIATACGHHHYLLSAATVSHFVSSLPSTFLSLPQVAQADYIRIHVLHRYGGMWLDADYILFDDPVKLAGLLHTANATILVTEEKEKSISNSLIVSYPHTSILQRVIDDMEADIEMYETRRRQGYTYVIRDFLGQRLLVKSIRTEIDEGNHDTIMVVSAERIANTTNRVVWHADPAYNISLWLMESESAAIQTARRIMDANVATIGLWTLSGGCLFLHDVIMHDSRSIFYQIMKLSQVLLS